MKISIITICLNAENEIEKTICSVLSQRDVDTEYIIVDGKSNDNTLKIINLYGDRIEKIISEKDDGIYAALNKGIKNSSGDILGFLHAGDFYSGNDVLKKVAEKFGESRADCIYGDLVYVSKSGRRVRYWRSGEYRKDKIKKGWMPPHPSFFVKRNVYLRHGLFDEKFEISSDYDLMMRFLWKAEVSAAYVPEILVNMRLGGKSNAGLKNILLKSAEDYRVIKKYNIGGMGVLLMKNFSKLRQFRKNG